MESVLYPSEKLKIANHLMDNYMKNCTTEMAECPCGAVMEVVEGTFDYKAKDDKGQLMSKEACEHLAKHRIRCQDCE